MSYEENKDQENSDLTDKQRLFIGYYLKCWNATKAYQKAYDCDYASAMANGNRMIRNDKIAAEIQKTRDEIFAESYLLTKTGITTFLSPRKVGD
ncbi:terminase small subunit [Paenibacillus apis]|uniref:terminase small subunit n=1 Tax=Paenibacillus apis TaxID=1792174 RepID=UPI002658649E|nr:terminase small subunit [Paenibacillus apis]